MLLYKALDFCPEMKHNRDPVNTNIKEKQMIIKSTRILYLSPSDVCLFLLCVIFFLFIHLFVLLALLPMPIFDLLSTFTSKSNQPFSDFLQAYSEIRQMKNITENLQIIANCIISEKGVSTKCLDYYITNEMDKVILQLHQAVDLDHFFCTMLRLLPDKYILNESRENRLFTEMWKYNKFYQVAKVYAEKIVSLKIYNERFASTLCESFPMGKEAVVVLCEIEWYLERFESIGNKSILLINKAIQERQEEAVALIEFLAFFEDKCEIDLLSHVNFIYKERTTERVLGDIPKCMDSVNYTNNEEEWLTYYFMIFKRVKSIKIRQKVLEQIPMFLDSNTKSIYEFMIECIKLDSITSSLMLNKHEESIWKPLELYNMLKQYLPYRKQNTENEKAQEASTDDFNNINNTIILETPADLRITQGLHNEETRNREIEYSIDNHKLYKQVSDILNDIKLTSLCLKWKKQPRKTRISLLFDSLLIRCEDIRIWTFILFVNETLILNNLEKILKNITNIEKRDKFCLLLLEKCYQ